MLIKTGLILMGLFATHLMVVGALCCYSKATFEGNIPKCADWELENFVVKTLPSSSTSDAAVDCSVVCSVNSCIGLNVFPQQRICQLFTNLPQNFLYNSSCAYYQINSTQSQQCTSTVQDATKFNTTVSSKVATAEMRTSMMPFSLINIGTTDTRTSTISLLINSIVSTKSLVATTNEHTTTDEMTSTKLPTTLQTTVGKIIAEMRTTMMPLSLINIGTTDTSTSTISHLINSIVSTKSLVPTTNELTTTDEMTSTKLPTTLQTTVGDATYKVTFLIGGGNSAGTTENVYISMQTLGISYSQSPLITFVGPLQRRTLYTQSFQAPNAGAIQAFKGYMNNCIDDLSIDSIQIQNQITGNGILCYNIYVYTNPCTFDCKLV